MMCKEENEVENKSEKEQGRENEMERKLKARLKKKSISKGESDEMKKDWNKWVEKIEVKGERGNTLNDELIT